MNVLASAIQERFETLVEEYDWRLQKHPDYAAMPASLRREAARRTLDFVAGWLESGDDAQLVHFIQAQAREWVAQGLDIEMMQHAVNGLEAILEPLVTDVETAKLVWHTLPKAREIITQQAAKTLRASEAKLRQLIDRLTVGFYRTTLEGRIVEANSAFFKITGYASLDAVNQIGVPGLYADPSDRQRLLQMLEHGPVTGFETDFRRPDGQIVSVSINVRLTPEEGVEGYLEGTLEDITERKRAEASLQESKQLLQLVMDNIPQSIFWKDTDLVYRGCNRQFVEEGSFSSPDQIVGKTAYDMPWADNAEFYHADDRQVIETNTPKLNIEEPLRRGDGALGWLRTNKIPMHDAQGQVIGILSTSEDITEQKRTEAALRESRQLLQTVMDNIPQAIFWKDKSLTYLGCNRAFAADAGLASPSDAIGKTDWDMPWKEQAELYRADDSRVMESGVPKLDYEEPQTTPDGSTIWLRTSKVPLRDATGNVTAVLGMYEDITERKQAEEALRESEEKYRTILDNIEDGYYEVDLAGNLTFFNDSLCRLYGYSKDELMGMNYRQHVDGETAKTVYQTYNTVFRTGNPSRALDWAAIRKDGTRRFVQVSVSLMHGATGEPVGFRGTVRDVTERKRAEEESRAARQQLMDIIDFLPDATFVIDQDKKVIAWNRAAEEMTGTRKEDILGQGDYAYAVPWWGERRPMVIDLIGMEDSEFRAKYDFVQKIGSNTLYAEVFVPRIFGGRGGYMAATAAPLLDSQGNMVGAIESVRDVTERKQAEEALRESRRLIQTVMDNIPQSIFWKDKNLVYLGCNRAFAADAGLTSPDDALGKTDWDMPWKEQAELYRADDHRVLESGVPKLNYEEPQTTPDGSIIWLRTSKVPMRDADGNVTAVLGMYEDITERKRLEQQVRDSAERRGYQVQTSTEVAQEIATAPALDELFQRVVTLIKERFGYYHAQIFQYKPALHAVLLVAGYGEAGGKMLAAGHRLEMGRGVVGTAASTGQSVLAADVTQDKDWQPNPNLPETKGELAVPIKLRDEVLGILDVQSNRVGVLTQDDQLLLEGLCGQIAVAMESTRLLGELRINEAQLSEALHIAKLAYWEYDVEKDLFLFNDQFYSLFHTTAEQEGGYQISSARYAQKFVHPDDLAVVGTEIERALASTDRHYSRPLDHRILYADGGVGHISVNINIDRDEQGRILRYYGANQDITENKRAEQAIMEEQRRTQTILETITVPMIISRLSDSKVLYANQALADFRHMDLNELIGSRTVDYFVNPDDRNKFVEILRRQGYAADFETQLRGSEGRVSWVLLSGRIINFQNETCVLSSYVDITERKQSETKMRETLQELERLYRATTREGWQAFRETEQTVAGYLFDRAELRPAEDVWLPEVEQAIQHNTLVPPADEHNVAVAPLSVRGEVIGAVGVYDDPQRPLSQEELGLVQEIAEQGALALESARLFEQTQLSLAEARTLYEAGRRVSSASSLQEMVIAVAEGVHVPVINQAVLWDLEYNTVGQPEAFIAVANWHSGQGALPLPLGTRFPLSQFPATNLVLGAEPIFMEDVERDARLDPVTRSVFQQQQARALVILPLWSGERQLGALMLVADQPHHFAENEVRLYTSLMRQMAVALENRRLFEQTRVALEEVEATHRRYLREQWETYLKEATEKAFGFVDGPGGVNPADEAWLPEMEQALEVGEPVIVSASESLAQRAALAVPIKLRGSPIGVLEFYDEGAQRTWGDDERALVQALADQAALALENARLFEETQTRAQREQLINTITARIRASTDMETILHTTAEELAKTLNLSRARIRLGTGNGDPPAGQPDNVPSRR